MSGKDKIYPQWWLRGSGKKLPYIYFYYFFFTSRVTSLHHFNVEHEFVSTEEKLASIAGSAAQQKAVAAQE